MRIRWCYRRTRYPVHPLSLLSSRKIANKTDKEFKMHIGMRVRMHLRMQFGWGF